MGDIDKKIVKEAIKELKSIVDVQAAEIDALKTAK